MCIFAGAAGKLSQKKNKIERNTKFIIYTRAKDEISNVPCRLSSERG